MSRALRLGTILVAFLVGCAHPPAVEPPAPGGLMLSAAERRERSSPGEAPVSAPLTATAPQGQRLARLTLEDAFARAERFHPGLSAAQAQIQGAEGRALQAGLFPNPELFARTEAAPVSGNFGAQAEYIVGISQPLPLSRRLSIARRVEGLDRDRVVHERDGKRWDVLMGVQSAFATALYWQRVIEARAEDVRLAENGVAAAKTRLAAGDAIPAEVGQTEVELGRAQLDLERATSMQAQAMEALVTAIGEPSLEVGALEGGLEQPLVLPSLESLRARFDQSPAVAASEADIAVQKARVELAEAQRTPDVSLDLSYRRLGDVENAFDVGVRLPIPLFNRFQGSIQEARAELAAAEARGHLVRNELGRELQASYRKLARAVASAKLLREDILPRAESVLQGAETRYRNGDISLAELLPIRRDWTRARLDYLEALNDVMQAWTALLPYLY
jgi:cobalt-zinc-cadmium efflux system outer membrane protein